jgi:hypothetical protein
MAGRDARPTGLVIFVGGLTDHEGLPGDFSFAGESLGFRK